MRPDRQVGVHVDVVRGHLARLFEKLHGPFDLAVVDLCVGGRDQQVGAIGFEFVRFEQAIGDELHVARHLGGEAGVRDACRRLVDLQSIRDQLVDDLPLADHRIEIHVALDAQFDCMAGKRGQQPACDHCQDDS